MKVNIEKSWLKLLKKEFDKEYFNELICFVKNEYNKSVCYPPKNLIFSSFNNCKLDNLKVVIMGQDPYHGQDQANGLCFSVDSKIVNPPSLNNILSLRVLFSSICMFAPFEDKIQHSDKATAKPPSLTS